MRDTKDAIASYQVTTEADVTKFELPAGVQQRLQELLDRQVRGYELSESERHEAEGLVELAEFLSLLRLQAKRAGQNT